MSEQVISPAVRSGQTREQGGGGEACGAGDECSTEERVLPCTLPAVEQRALMQASIEER